jgi:predicted TIM-barrel fold metal-dependent hydrolase
MYPFLDKYDSQPIVLIHSGYPWINETSYLAATFPSVYLDLSEITVWAPSQTDWVLEMMLGWVPGSKILYGSDTCTEPEQYWLGATFARSALERSLQRLIERDLLSREQALLMGQGVLSRNTREVHGIS